MATKKSADKGRSCSVCKQHGHNSRTCPVKKKSEAHARPRDREEEEGGDEALVASTALVALPPEVVAGASPGTRHEPVSFTAVIRQEHLDGQTVKVELRDYTSGVSTMMLRFQDDASVKDVLVNVPLAGKLYEMLGWALQQVARKGKALPVTRTSSANGVQQAAASEGR